MTHAAAAITCARSRIAVVLLPLLSWAAPAFAQSDTPCSLPGSEDSAVEALCDLHDGLARFKLDGRWGALDRNGEVAIPPRFAELGHFDDGLAPARSGERWGYVDRQGRWVIAPAFEQAEAFSHGRASAKREGGHWGQIDRQGQWTIAADYGFIGPYNGHTAIALRQDGRSVMVNGQGMVVQRFPADTSVRYRPNDAGLYPMQRRREELLVNVDGRQFPMPKDTASRELRDALMIVRPPRDGERAPGPLRGAVDVQSRLQVPARFEILKDFRHGLAVARTPDGPGLGLVDTHGAFKLPERYQQLDDEPRGWYVGHTKDATDLIDRRGRVRQSIDCPNLDKVRVQGPADGPWAVLAGCGQSWVLRAGLRRPIRAAVAAPTVQADEDHLILSTRDTDSRSGADDIAMQVFDASGRLVFQSDGHRLEPAEGGVLDRIVLVARTQDTPRKGPRALPVALLSGDGRVGVLTSDYTLVTDPLWRADSTWGTYRPTLRGEVPEGPLPVQTEAGFGAIDADGQWIVAPRFRRLERFHHGLAEAIDEHRIPWIVDAQGHAVEPPPHFRHATAVAEGVMLGNDGQGALYRFTVSDAKLEHVNLPEGVRVRADAFHGGLASAKSGERYGLIDPHGRWRLPPRYDAPFQPRQNKAHQHIGWTSTVTYRDQDSRHRLHGWVDADGRQIVPPRYEELTYRAVDDTLRVNGPRAGVLSLQGQVLLPPRYEQVRALGDGWFAAWRPDWEGLVDAQGQVVAAPRDVDLSSAADIVPRVRYVQGQPQLIDLRGRVSTPQVPLQADEAAPGTWWPMRAHAGQDDVYTVFRDLGFKVRAVVPGKVDKWHRYSEGVIAFKPRLPTARAQVGLADSEGRVLGRYPFDLIASMHEGRAAFQQSSRDDDGELRFHFGYLDRQGRIAIPARFSGARPFNEGRAVVIARHNLGLADREGKVLAQGAWRCGREPVLIGENDRIVWPSNAPASCDTPPPHPQAQTR
ncbi:WG repeat-containing protein [Pseudoxanthomonas sp. JBR18]|uniref:WG repeat-containing protein n=1 Tax=Pseudoxanthomonas sp. JBR18 TaxID=2969308 RepID=UPI002306C99F|nr:WG repeat-containing protein [Pseudoxanthomonas sp. JBR18]WCE04222.1 WG repeat-containing protein [Pseudoxanthomonas sp. JBR18]